MKALSRFFLWYWLLTKRLLRRPAFWIILLCVPLLSGAMAAAARQESGIVRIALVCSDDSVARRSADRLLHADSLVRCTEYATEAEARDAVRQNRADAAWIFRDNATEELQRYVSRRGTHGVVQVVEREDNVFLRLAREQLAGALYPEASRAPFRTYLVENMGVAADSPDALFERYYSTEVEDTSIIVFRHTDGSDVSLGTEYLVAPVRGLLALLLVLSGLASAMHYYEEERREVYLRLRAPLRRFLPLLCHFAALVPVGAAALLALRAAGLLGAWPREVGVMLLYCVTSAAFCELLRKLCRSQARLGALIPILMAVMLALCPVFFDLKLLEPLRRLLPPYYYLNAIHSGQFLRQLAIFTLAAAALAALLPDTARNTV